MDDQSSTPFRCEVPWHAHTDDQRGATCRPDSLLHPDMAAAAAAESER